MFGRKPEESTSGMDGYQQAADPATEAMDFINTTLFDLEVQGVHPWHAPDATHLQFALASTALACDRTAELLRQKGVREKRGGETVASPDIVAFGQMLSRISIDQFQAANNMLVKQTDATFDEEVAASLYPENMLPYGYWPRAYENGVSEPWQGDEQPEVTVEFIKGIVEAGFEFQAHAATDAEKFADNPHVPVPPEFEDLYPFLQEIIGAGQKELETAQKLVKADKVPADMKAQAYGLAYSGFIKMMHALLASKTPQVLGPDFFPQR